MGDHRLHVLGRQELALLAGGEHVLPPYLEAEDEADEDDIPEEYGVENQGFMLRTLTEICLYHEDGSPAALESLDVPNRTRIVAFGTLLPPDYRPKPREVKRPPPQYPRTAAPTPAPFPAPTPAPAPSSSGGSSGGVGGGGGGLKLKIRLGGSSGGGGASSGGGGGSAAATEPPRKVGVISLKRRFDGSRVGENGPSPSPQPQPVLKQRIAAAESSQTNQIALRRSSHEDDHSEDGHGTASVGQQSVDQHDGVCSVARSEATERGQGGGGSGEDEEDWDGVGLRVYLAEITDWCMDYSNGHAIQWLVTPYAWYRIFGTQYTFLRPHYIYKRIYNSAFKKFISAASTARVLLQVYPANPQADYQTVFHLIIQKSNGRVQEPVLLENAEFLGLQMRELVDPGGSQYDYEHCAFIQELQARARSMGIRPMGKKERDKLLREIGQGQRECVEAWLADLEGENAEANRAAWVKAKETRQAAVARARGVEDFKPVLDDLQLLGPEANIPRPAGEPASRYLPLDLFPSILVVWNTLQLCCANPDFNLLKLTPFKLEDLEMAVTSTTKGLCPTLVLEVIHRLLATILADRKDPGRPLAVAVLDEEEEEGKEPGKVNRPVESLEQILYKGVYATHLLPFGWQEMTRVLIAERFKIPLEMYLDPLAELQRMLEDLQTSNKQAAPFFHQVDTSRLPVYAEIVHEPMDLGTILARLRTGYYEEPEVGRGPYLRVPKPKAKPPLMAPTMSQPTDPSTDDKEDEEEEDDDEEEEAAGPRVKFKADTGTSRTKGKGPRGVIEDIRLVWSNCEKFNGPDASLTELALNIAEDFEEMIQRRILEPLEKRDRALGRLPSLPEKKKPHRRDEDDDTPAWAEVVDELGRLTYAELPVKTRVMVLRWMADEVVGTQLVRDFLESLQGRKENYKKLAIKKRAYMAQQKAAQQGIEHHYPQKISWTAEDAEAFEKASPFAHKDIRLKSFGTDRHHRRYFSFPGDATRYVYTEEVADGPCTVVYKNREALLSLVSWLSDRTPREAPLRKILSQFTERYHPEGVSVGKAVLGGSATAGAVVKEEGGTAAAGGGAEGGTADPAAATAAAAGDGDAAVKKEDFNNYTNSLGAYERDNAADMYKYLLFPLGITAKERVMLGLVYIEGDLKLTAYRDANQRPIKDAQGRPIREAPSPRLGINLGDRIVMVNGMFIDQPKWPIGPVPDPSTMTYSSLGEPEDSQLLVYRESSQIQTDNKGLAERVVASEWGFVQGWLLHVEKELSNPLALGIDWPSKRMAWREKIIRSVNGSRLNEAALELEACLKAKGSLLVKEDREGRARGISSKWRQFVHLARTPSQLLLGLRLLYFLLDRRILQRATTKQDRFTWIEQLPPHRRIQIPDKGDIVIYYPEGHREANKHNKRFRAPMWGVDAPNDKPGKPKVQICQVDDVSYYSLASIKDPFALSAWAKIKLKRLAEPPLFNNGEKTLQGTLRLYRPAEPRAVLSRMLARVVFSAMEMREADQFCDPVNKRQYPDYYNMIKSPMDFGTLLSRIRRYRYSNLEEFLADLSLINKNCHQYCYNRFPTLPVLADKVVTVARQTAKELEFRIREAEKEAMEMAARANLWERMEHMADSKETAKEEREGNGVKEEGKEEEKENQMDVDEQGSGTEEEDEAEGGDGEGGQSSTAAPPEKTESSTSAEESISAAAARALTAKTEDTLSAPARSTPAAAAGEASFSFPLAPPPPAPLAQGDGEGPVKQEEPQQQQEQTTSTSAAAALPKAEEKTIDNVPPSTATVVASMLALANAPPPSAPPSQPPSSSSLPTPPPAPPSSAGATAVESLSSSQQQAPPPPSSAGTIKPAYAPTPTPAPYPQPQPTPNGSAYGAANGGSHPPHQAGGKPPSQYQHPPPGQPYYQPPPGYPPPPQGGAPPAGGFYYFYAPPPPPPPPTAASAGGTTQPSQPPPPPTYGYYAPAPPPPAAPGQAPAPAPQPGYYYYGAPAPQPPPVPPSHAQQTTAPPRQPSVVETFTVGVWLTNAVPEFLVKRERFEAATKREWRKEDRFAMRWSSPEGTHHDQGTLYEGTVVGIKALDAESGMMPWEAFQVQWNSDGENFGYVNPWTIDVLPSESGRVVTTDLEYGSGALKAFDVHAHSLLDIPNRSEAKPKSRPPATAAAHAPARPPQPVPYGAYAYPHHPYYPPPYAAALPAGAGGGGAGQASAQPAPAPGYHYFPPPPPPPPLGYHQPPQPRH